MMTAPYRGATPAGGDAEAREIEAFARAMHAERRVWGNENFSKMVLGTFVAVPYTLLIAGFYLAAAPGWATLLNLLPALPWAAGAVDSFVRWRRDMRRA